MSRRVVHLHLSVELFFSRYFRTQDWNVPRQAVDFFSLAFCKVGPFELTKNQLEMVRWSGSHGTQQLYIKAVVKCSRVEGKRSQFVDGIKDSSFKKSFMRCELLLLP